MGLTQMGIFGISILTVAKETLLHKQREVRDSLTMKMNIFTFKIARLIEQSAYFKKER